MKHNTETLRHLADKLHLKAEHRNNFRALAAHHLCDTMRNVTPSDSNEKAGPSTTSTALNTRGSDKRHTLVEASTLSFMAAHGSQLWPALSEKRGHLTSKSTAQKDKSTCVFYAYHGFMSHRERRAFRRLYDREPTGRERELCGVIGKLMSAYFEELLTMPDLATAEEDDDGFRGDAEALVQAITEDIIAGDERSIDQETVVGSDVGNRRNKETGGGNETSDDHDD